MDPYKQMKLLQKKKIFFEKRQQEPGFLPKHIWTQSCFTLFPNIKTFCTLSSSPSSKESILCKPGGIGSWKICNSAHFIGFLAHKGYF